MHIYHMMMFVVVPRLLVQHTRVYHAMTSRLRELEKKVAEANFDADHRERAMVRIPNWIDANHKRLSAN